MKKRICPPLLLAAMLSMTACTEVLEPNVDYGSNTYTNDYSALVKAVNDLQKSLEDRFDALNSLLNAGMADIKIAIDENTGAIEVLEATTNSGLAKIDTSIVNGFNAISTSVDSAGNKVVTALDENGNLLRLTIDNNGKLLNTALGNLATMLENIDKSLTNHNASFDTKISALNDLLSTGLADVSLNLKGIGSTLDLQKAELIKISTNLDYTNTHLENINTGLRTLKDELKNGFTLIGEKIDANGEKIVEAMNDNGDVIKVAINGLGTVISAQTTTLSDILKSEEGGLPALVKAQGELKTAIKDLTAQEKTNAENLVKKLDELLNNEGIYVVESDGKTDVYVTKEKWDSMNQTERENTFEDLVKETEVEVNRGMTFAYLTININTVESAEATLQAVNLQTYPDVSGSKTKQLYKLYKIPETIKLNISGSSYNQGNRLCCYIITDASGKHGKSSKSGLGSALESLYWTYSFTPTAYPIKNGKILWDNGKALVNVDFYNCVPQDAADMTIDD